MNLHEGPQFRGNSHCAFLRLSGKTKRSCVRVTYLFAQTKRACAALRAVDPLPEEPHELRPKKAMTPAVLGPLAVLLELAGEPSLLAAHASPLVVQDSREAVATLAEGAREGYHVERPGGHAEAVRQLRARGIVFKDELVEHLHVPGGRFSRRPDRSRVENDRWRAGAYLSAAV